MSTKLQYPINQLRDGPIRPTKNKATRGSGTPSQHLSTPYYPDINPQRPGHAEESQTFSNGSFPRKDREYRLMTEQPDVPVRHSVGRTSSDSLHESSHRHKRSEAELPVLHDQHSLPELGKKGSHGSPSSPTNSAESSSSPTYHPQPTLPQTAKQQLQIRHRHRDSPHLRSPTSFTESEPEGRVEIGLENLGNTCFMNSALQCLLHIQPLVDYFMQGLMERDLNPTSPKKGMLASSFNHLIQEVIAKRTGSSVAPTNFQKAVAVFAPYLLDFQQQDSQEFLRFLLDGMSEDLCRRRQLANLQTGTSSLASTALVTTTPGHLVQPIFHSESSHHEKPTSSGSAGRLSAKSAQQAAQSILPMLPGATIERLHTPPHSGGTVNVKSPSATEGEQAGTTSIISPRYNSVQKLRMETRALHELAEQQQNQQQQQSADPATTLLSSDVSAKVRITREISAARKMVSDDSVIGTSSTAALDAMVGSGNNNAKVSLNFAETAPAALSSLMPTISSPDHPTNENRVESAPATARTPYAPSFSRQLRDVMTGKTLRLRRDRTNSASSQNSGSAGANSGDDSGSGRVVGDASAVGTVKIVNVEEEAMKAWDRYLKFNDSIITDLFGGLLQSTVQCLTCQHRSYAFDPFLDLSVPIYREGETSSRGLFSSIRQATSTTENRSTLEKCLEKFTAEEVLDGDNMVTCERCSKPRKSIKQLSIYRYPKILVVHIKRFRFNNFSREKLSTDVHFPMAALDLGSYMSHDRPKSSTKLPPNNNHENPPTQRDASNEEVSHVSSSLPPVNTAPGRATANPSPSAAAAPGIEMTRPVSGEEPPPVYDLIGVSNHHGTLNGGHYVAHVDTDFGRSRGQSPRWVCFNDARVSLAQAAHIAGPTAYVLFYKLRDDSEA